MGILTQLWSFHNIYEYQNIKLYTLHIYNFCQLYLDKMGGNPLEKLRLWKYKVQTQ